MNVFDVFWELVMLKKLFVFFVALSCSNVFAVGQLNWGFNSEFEVTYPLHRKHEFDIYKVEVKTRVFSGDYMTCEYVPYYEDDDLKEVVALFKFSNGFVFGLNMFQNNEMRVSDLREEKTEMTDYDSDSELADGFERECGFLEAQYLQLQSEHYLFTDILFDCLRGDKGGARIKSGTIINPWSHYAIYFMREFLKMGFDYDEMKDNSQCS